MYCYACGNKIYNGLLKCPYCGSGMESIQKILEEQTIEENRKVFQCINDVLRDYKDIIDAERRS